MKSLRPTFTKRGPRSSVFRQDKVPCILLSQKDYEQLLQKVYDKNIRADTLLDIFYDRQDVFVDVQVKLLDTDFEQNFLLYANALVEFFEALAESGMISFAPDTPAYTNSQNVFMIQLPRKDAPDAHLE